MRKYYALIESRVNRISRSRNAGLRAVAIAAGMLFALPIVGTLYRGSFGGMEVVVAATGIAVLAVVAGGIHTQRQQSFAKPRSTVRHTVGARSGEPLLQEAK